jgi:hypothetical protein
MMAPGQTVGQEKAPEQGSAYDYTPLDVVTIVKDLWQKPTNALDQIGTVLVKAVESIPTAVADLDAKSAVLINALGVGSGRGAELTQTLASAIPKYLELGLKSGKVAEDQEKLINAFNVNLRLTDKQLVELAATAMVTGQAGELMATSFMDVGIPLSMVGTRMKEVVDVANKAGVTVKAVSAGVVANLDKMNIYNFEGGVKGLAKMAAQASRLGIDMKEIFAVTEKVFNPEGAIEMAAGLQRLGVTSSEMLDPLRLMDLAQNDPGELQNQIVNLGKEFTVFNKQNKSFEILPGAKRRMQEIGKELGLSAGEFQKMTLNAANFDMKLKSLKFSTGVKEEDKELIATMAQINESGVAEIKVRQMVTDKEGKESWTGKYDTKDVDKLTPDDIKALREEEKLQGETMEEIAQDQLSQLVQLNGAINSLAGGIAYGVAGSESVQSAFKTGTKEATKGIKDVKDVYVNPDTIAKTLDDTLKTIMGYFNGWDLNMSSITTGLGSLYDTVVGYIKDLGLTSKTTTATPAGTTTNPASSLAAAGTTTPPPSTTTTNIAMTHTFDFTNLPSNANTADIKKILEDSISVWAKLNITQDEAQHIVKVGSGTNYGQTPKTSNVA